jgi:hypothetical protein
MFEIAKPLFDQAPTCHGVARKAMPEGAKNT